MNNELAIREVEPAEMLDIQPDEARRSLQAIKAFQNVVQTEMVKGHDYGVIQGTDRPTLLKPGAEKLAKLLKCSDTYEIDKEEERWDKDDPFFYYRVRCTLKHMQTGTVISEGIGSCNSLESRYRWRWVFSSELPDGIDKSKLQRMERKSRKTGKPYVHYRIENDDIFTQVNTLQKMACKRSLVDAALHAGRLSDVFTQDLEDFAAGWEEINQPDAGVIDVEEAEEKKPEQVEKAISKNSEPENSEKQSTSEEDQLFAQIREVLEAQKHDELFINRRMEGLKPQNAEALKTILANEKKRLQNGNGKEE